MSKEIVVEFTDGREETHVFPEKLYDLDWKNYQAIERKIKMNASLDRNGEVDGFNVSEDKLGDFLVDIQSTMAEKILEYNNIDIDNVNTRTVKRVINQYGDDMSEMGLKLKKKSRE